MAKLNPIEQSSDTKPLQQITKAKKEWEITVDALPQLICLVNQEGPYHSFQPCYRKVG